ncbi:universal stress protein [Arthrobacter agilis]|uniref:universal stress protein n=1 Tax=Arthrobacter agilis TaxID=37921 RepID=UPI000B34ADAF|nr:universal stress protein [Arthrobacter agilis]OUM40631.1 universal stress protein UspA [Arthrobacter agilis]PPB45243.1 universal stress protein [Arthrobacter agilis]TPV27947.1 universal stress protein [Arthrobacter agilis]WDF34092.1 universal stress protein [Arthrobacter agilis]VDR31368.1 universal stress protein UspE [Arthrobacter agilis]
MSSIVVGYVPNALGEAAVAQAVEEARRRDAELVVINTTRADRLVNPAYADDADVSKLEGMLRSTGVAYSIRHSISEATAAEEVVDVAQELDAELIVIGLRHRTPVGKLIMGSTAQTILLSARCNVLAVKLP